jgi:Domain of unknown function (DUF4157)
LNATLLAAGAQRNTEAGAAVAIAAATHRVSPLLQRRCGCGGAAGLSGLCSACDSERRLGAPPLQAKLKVSAPGDAHEQEADRIADAVVDLQVSPPSHASASGPQPAATLLAAGPAGPNSHEAWPLTAMLQRRALAEVSGNEDEDQQALPEADPSGAGPTPETATEPDDDEAVQRRASPAPGRSGRVPLPDFQARLDARRSGGQPIEPGLRLDLEQRFGLDLSAVRLHTDGAAADLAQQVQAQAFTVGQHVFFGAGHYHPGDRTGLHLLSHELVHTVQQTGARPLHARADAGAANPDRAPTAHDRMGTPVRPEATVMANTVQRSVVEDSFVPPRLPDGELVHQQLLKAYGLHNPDLFTEVGIPGAKATHPADVTGRADMYMADPATTIGVVMLEVGESAQHLGGYRPRYLRAHTDLLKGGKAFDHAGQGAPKAVQTGGTKVDGKPVEVARIDQAPSQIWIGDLKPPPSLAKFGEATIQIDHYSTGLTDTATKLNDFAKDHPDLADPSGARWSPTVQLLGGSKPLTIPKDYAVDGKGGKSVPLRLYSGRKSDDAIAGLTGHLATYKATEDGTWNYEWVPAKLPDWLRTSGTSPQMQRALVRIDQLVRQVKSPPPTIAPTVQKKPLAVGLQPTRRIGPAGIQRKESFDAKTWPTEFKTWQQTEAKPILGSNAIGVVDLVPGEATPQSQDAMGLRMAVGLKQLQQRIPTAQQTPAIRTAGGVNEKTRKAFDRMRLWARFGGVLGRLRAVFGTVYVKIAGLFERAKEKFEELRKSTAEEAPTSGGSIAAAIAKGAFKAATSFLRVMLQRTVREFTGMMKRAAPVLVEDLVGEERVQKLVDGKKNLESMVTEAEGAVERQVHDLKEVAAPFIEIFEKIRKVNEWAGNVARLVSAVRWGLRIINCATPPGVGCLKLILQAVVEELAAKVIRSCWFVGNFIQPLIAKAPFFKTLPKTLATFLTRQVKQIAGLLPFSPEVLDKAFTEPTVNAGVVSSDLDCDRKVLTPAQIAMNKLADTYTPEQLQALIALLEAAGLTGDAEMTLKDVEIARGLLEKLENGEVTMAQIAQATANLSAGKGAGQVDVALLVNQLSGLQGSGGGGAAAKSAVKVTRFEEAQTTPPGAASVSRSRMYVRNDRDGVSPGDEVKVELVGTIDGEVVAVITDVPARVVSVGTVQESDGLYRQARYGVKSPVVFRHDVPGVPHFVAGPAHAIPGLLFPIEDAAPAKSGAATTP